MECFWDSTGLAFRMQFASFDYWCAVFLIVWTDLFLIQASIEDRDKMTHHSAPTPFFSRSMCTLRETNYWHEMWPTQLDLSQPPKIGWSRSHHMMIKILWYVDLLSFRPNSLTWSTNLEKHYFWVLKGNTTFNLVQGGTEVGGTEGVKGNSHKKYAKSEFPTTVGFGILQLIYLIWYIGLDL